MFQPPLWEETETAWILHAEQRSQIWFDIKQGRLGASNFENARNKYAKNLAEEMKSTIPKKFDVIQQRHIDRGINSEPIIRKWYQERTGYRLVDIGLALSKRNLKINCSPDNIIVDEEGKWIGLSEYKAPEKMYHYYFDHCELIDSTSVMRAIDPKDSSFIQPSHYAQMQGNMGIINLPWCDYVVYTENFQLLHRVFFDGTYFEEMFGELEEFLLKYAL